MKVTNDGIDYCAAPYGNICYIPAGVPVIEATNLPGKGQYWVQEWPGMNDKADSWLRNYGFLVDESQVCESPFVVGQRVRIKPCKNYPKIKTVRYGIIVSATKHLGMSLMDKERASQSGEWAFSVASYANPSAGAMWFSAEGLEPMKRVSHKRK